MKRCIYCNRVVKTTNDHIFEVCVNKGAKHLYAPACGRCNSGIFNDDKLSDMLVSFDDSLADSRLRYYMNNHNSLRNLFSRFLREDESGFNRFYPDHKIVMVFKKWVMGLRWIELKKNWFFIPHNNVHIFSIVPYKDRWVQIDQPRRENKIIIPEMFEKHIVYCDYKTCGKFKYNANLCRDKVVDFVSIQFGSKNRLGEQFILFGMAINCK